MAKVLILGLDGAPWRLFERWIGGSRMPNLAALAARGTWGPLRSTVPALTLPAWASFMTGKNPGGHGIFGFRRTAPDRYESGRLANASDLRSVTLWDVAGRAGKRVGVVNVPPSYPIRPVNGFVVSCMLTPAGERFSHPPEIEAELGDYRIDLLPPRNLRSSDPDYAERALAYLHGLRDQTRLRGEAVVRLMERQPWELLCAVFYAPDRVQHYFWDLVDGTLDAPGDRGPIADAVAAVYETLDAAVGRLVAAAGPETAVIVLSDHGFAPKPARSVRINRWLADNGLLQQRALWTLRRKVIRKALPAAWRARWDTVDHILVNRAKTRAWSDTIFTDTAGIWIHTAGRYPLGCVRPGAEYAAVRDRIEAGLRALTDEEGRRVFRLVGNRDALYSGPYTAEAPDVVAVCDERFGVLFESLRRDLRTPALFGSFDEEGYTASHDPLGIYLFAGPPIAALGAHQEYPIESIAPTALHLLDVPVPRSMEGPVCATLLRDDFRAAHPVQWSEEPDPVQPDVADWSSSRDEAEVAERLRALGYME